ncbi:hypothetical protein [Chromobacterium piscinae]|uniref:hypothetical protein n=1 Tax=Chromobacterium piscinae TaxID=686831 RepID=UPI00320828E6
MQRHCNLVENRIKRMMGMVWLLCLPWAAQAALESDTRCFVAANGGRPIHLQFTTVGDADSAWSVAYVRYGKRGKAITLVWLCTEQEEMAEGRPYQFTEEWLEIVDGRINGRYTTIHQGANYYGFHYRGINGRDIDFEEDLGARAASKGACQY